MEINCYKNQKVNYLCKNEVIKFAYFYEITFTIPF